MIFELIPSQGGEGEPISVDRFLPIRGYKIKGEYWFHLNGKTFTSREVGRASHRTPPPSSRPPRNRVLAPMPGKILKVFAGAKGSSVKKGEALLVLEAMKMEYTLKSDMDGYVESILCEEGDQVPLGTLLITLGSGPELSA